MMGHARRMVLAGYEFARAELILVMALGVLAGGVLAFVEVVDEVHEGESSEFDRTILLALREPHDIADPIGPRWLEHAMIDITSLGGTSVLTLLTLFVVGYLLAAGKPRVALLTGVSVTGAALTMRALKELFERGRPDVVPHLVEVTSASFPSGHAMVATAAYLTLAVIVAEASGRRVGIYVMTCALTISLLIGFTRMYLGVHWPTDVLAGWCGGAAWAAACWLITYRFVTRQTQSPTT